MRFTIAFILMFALTGCAQNIYEKFYYAYTDMPPEIEFEMLSEGAEPKIIGSDNIEEDELILRSKRYAPIGYSSFNGGFQDIENVIKQAKRVGALIVLVNSEYTNTQTNSSVLFLPDNKTTNHSGSVNGNTQHSGGGSSSTSGTYSGTSTTYGTKAVPYTTQQRRFDQNALYFVKSTQKFRFGIMFDNLAPQDRKRMERNTGVVIKVVIDATPAFYANILIDDVLIKVNDQLVKNVDHAMQLMGAISPEKESSKLTIIRNGVERDIEVKF